MAKSTHDREGYSPFSLDKWTDMWAKGLTGWHEENLSEFYVKYGDQLLAGRENITVFFPLCGKTVEMKHVYDIGHQVVGVEVASQALEEFFAEHKVEYATEKLEKGGTLYKSADGRIRLYCMDLFEFGPDLENGIEAVWDRGSLEAINKEDRNKYIATIFGVLRPDFRYLVLCFEYDPEEYPGPPHTFTASQIEEVFAAAGRALTVTHLESREESEDTKKQLNITNLKKCVYLVKPKS